MQSNHSNTFNNDYLDNREQHEQQSTTTVSDHLRARSVSREHLVSTDSDLIKSSSRGGHHKQRSNNLKNSEPRHSHSLMSLDQVNISLSKNSKLNKRYLNTNQSESLESPNLQLSETSKLNKRYVSTRDNNHHSHHQSSFREKASSPPASFHKHHHDSRLASLSKRSMSLQELGLATSALNDRYFVYHHHNPANKGSHSTVNQSESIVAEAGPSKAASNISLTEQISDGKLREIGKTKKHGQSSSSSASSLSSNEFTSSSPTHLHSSSHHEIVKEAAIDPEMRRRSADLSSRYVRNNNAIKQQLTSASSTSKIIPYSSHSTKAFIDRSTTGRESEYGFSGGVRSSALSDTSEAPSLASHVKNIKIPSHTSDLDQYLDDLFNPVLDCNLDELSDARSLAASIKGGSQYYSEELGDDKEVDEKLDRIFGQFGVNNNHFFVDEEDEGKVGEEGVEEELSSSLTHEIIYWHNNDHIQQQLNACLTSFNQGDTSLDDINISLDELAILSDADKLANSLRGGGSKDKHTFNENNKDSQNNSLQTSLTTVTFGTNDEHNNRHCHNSCNTSCNVSCCDSDTSSSSVNDDDEERLSCSTKTSTTYQDSTSRYYPCNLNNSCHQSLSLCLDNIDLPENVAGCQLNILSNAENLVTVIKGGDGSSGDNEQLNLSTNAGSTITFGTGSMVPNQQQSTAIASDNPSATSSGFSSFTPEAMMKAANQEPPTINTNMPFTNIAGMTVPMVDTSQVIQQQLVHQSMLQRAFLAHAVQQNLQIQQQLLHQNQALQQILGSNSPSAGITSPTSDGTNMRPLSPIINPAAYSLLQAAPMDVSDIASSASPFANSFTPNSSSKLSETTSPPGFSYQVNIYYLK